MSLQDLRKTTDEIDIKIIKLLAERLKLSRQIGQEKKESRKPIEDRQREAQVIKNVRDLAKKEGVSPEDIERIYKLVINASKSVQGMEVGFQGEPGAYSQEAAVSFFGPSVETGPFDTLEEIFAAVQEGTLPYGIIPVENSQVGSITRSYDLLLDTDVMVRGETQIKITHYLIANKGATLESIKKVYSHPQALAQCAGYLKMLGCEVIPTYDTAGSVKMIKEQKIMDGAAIASAKAAQIYDMKILASEIEDNHNNTTRFFILSSQDSAPTGNDKTSIVFMLQHKPGTLYEALRAFADRGINLTKIESRPTRQKPWEYNFYLDFEGHRKDAAIQEALAHLKDNSTFLKVLGSYPKATAILKEFEK
jgi:chorismate mutase/prephenate dehydratase